MVSLDVENHLQIPANQGENCFIFHTNCFPNPITLCISSNSMAGVPTCETKHFEVQKKQQDVSASEKMGETKTTQFTFFVVLFLDICFCYISKKELLQVPMCLMCFGKICEIYVTPLKIIMEHNHGGLFQIILPFFSWMMAVGSSRESSRVYMTYTKNQLIWV